MKTTFNMTVVHRVECEGPVQERPRVLQHLNDNDYKVVVLGYKLVEGQGSRSIDPGTFVLTAEKIVGHEAKHDLG